MHVPLPGEHAKGSFRRFPFLCVSYVARPPQLPIPKLDDTCQRWLAAVTPLMTADELRETAKAIEAFRTGAGPKLQEALVARDQQQPDNSYINDWWKDMYLREMRAPLPVNVNPFLQLVDDSRTRDQCVRAASLVASSVRFLMALRRETLEPDIYHIGKTAQQSWFKLGVTLVPKQLAYYCAYLAKSYPLDMAQYPWLFGTSRLASPGRDVLYTDSAARHIAVLANNSVYSVTVLSPEGVPLPQRHIEAALRWIVRQPSAQPLGVGSLTALARDDWAGARPRLLARGNNRALMAALEGAVLALCLDPRPAEDAASGAAVFLHARHNRYYDKSLQLIVAGNGRAGINFEHSWGDGVSVLRFANEICEDSFAHELSAPSEGATCDPQIVTPLPIDLSSVRGDLVRGDAWLKERGDKLTAAELRVKGVGKDFFKKKKIAPDGTVQNAIQLAYRKAFGKTVATYESASTAGFRKGRTETIRPATIESRVFVDAFLDDSSGSKERERLLRAAAEAHRRNSTLAATGQGMDRHLFALRKIALEQNMQPLPPLFVDPSYARMNHNVLSTSTLVSPFLDGGGFGPVVEDGFGIGYGTTDDAISFSCTTFRSDMKPFLQALQDSLHQIKKTLD
jgi:carnitine O-palmitoyltransferase 2